jgi:hypothetical protein
LSLRAIHFSAKLSLSEWRKGFDVCVKKEALKVLLYPVESIMLILMRTMLPNCQLQGNVNSTLGQA